MTLWRRNSTAWIALKVAGPVAFSVTVSCLPSKSSFPAYAAYTKAVREEYAFVPDEAFREGRAAVLRHLLDLPRLFRTPYGTAHWESAARDNLTTELRLLAPPGTDG